MAQELLTNARKHGTGAVTLTVSAGPQTLAVGASNPVAAAGAPTPGYGLLGVQERVRAVGGRLRVSRGATFEIIAELPLRVHDEIAEMTVQP